MERPESRDILAIDVTEVIADESGVSEEALAKIMGSVTDLPDAVARMMMSAGDALGKSFGLKSNTAIARSYTVPYTAGCARPAAFASCDEAHRHSSL